MCKRENKTREKELNKIKNKNKKVRKTRAHRDNTPIVTPLHFSRLYFLANNKRGGTLNRPCVYTDTNACPVPVLSTSIWRDYFLPRYIERLPRLVKREGMRGGGGVRKRIKAIWRGRWTARQIRSGVSPSSPPPPQQPSWCAFVCFVVVVVDERETQQGSRYR